jgi:Family of unknown function (DUF6152)
MLASYVRIAIASSSLSIPSIVLAHHAAAGLYDRDASAEVEGKVTSVFWRNPHVRYTVLGTDENGQPETWQIEGGSVNTLERVGVHADMVKVGDFVKFSGYPGRGGRRALFAHTVTLPSGQQVALYIDLNDRYAPAEDSSHASDPGARGLFRVWIPTHTVGTGSGHVSFPLTEKARAAKAAYNPADDTALRCIPQGMPGAMDNPYPIEFTRHGDEITLRLEEWDGVRTIHMNADADAKQQPRSRMGYSVGRWDGDALVVKTTDIDWPYFDDLGTPLTSDAVVLERFSPDASGNHLSWEAQITDPEIFTEPVTLNIEWEYLPGQEIKPYNCTLPGN